LKYEPYRTLHDIDFFRWLSAGSYNMAEEMESHRLSVSKERVIVTGGGGGTGGGCFGHKLGNALKNKGAEVLWPWG